MDKHITTNDMFKVFAFGFDMRIKTISLSLSLSVLMAILQMNLG